VRAAQCKTTEARPRSSPRKPHSIHTVRWSSCCSQCAQRLPLNPHLPCLLDFPLDQKQVQSGSCVDGRCRGRVRGRCHGAREAVLCWRRLSRTRGPPSLSVGLTMLALTAQRWLALVTACQTSSTVTLRTLNCPHTPTVSSSSWPGHNARICTRQALVSQTVGVVELHARNNVSSGLVER
jgi:hypothetical protein